jgi:hypothetical protein
MVVASGSERARDPEVPAGSGAGRHFERPVGRRPGGSIVGTRPAVRPLVPHQSTWRRAMLKGGLLWMIGIPIPIIILLFLFGVL